MANNSSDGPSDDFFEQILGMSSFAASGTTGGGFSGSGASVPMTLRLGSGGGAAHLPSLGDGGGGFNGSVFPLGLNLEQGRGGFLEPEDASRSSDRFMDGGRAHSVRNVFHGQPMPATFAAAPHAPTMRPRVRARRGQATDPHSIAERLRRERIAERMRALQELVPSVNKSDRAAMLDEIVDYVKFLRLQVKVLSMSRLGGAGAVAPLVTDIPLSSIEEEGSEPAWEKCSSDGTERQVAKLMEENIGSAMQLLQSKALCIMPVSLAAAIYHSPPSDPSQGRN